MTRIIITIIGQYKEGYYGELITRGADYSG